MFVEAAAHTVKYERRKDGRYYANVTLENGDEHLFIVEEAANHMRTTDYFKWHAYGYQRKDKDHGHDRTRAGAVRSLMIRKGLTREVVGE